mmetsp:Transcript_150418/g.483430  ORF Transcript_150418/g.483430 Transcript_150418/m.483430 type:complete len:120 (-) Transcript_150418:62-421(-)
MKSDFSAKSFGDDASAKVEPLQTGELVAPTLPLGWPCVLKVRLLQEPIPQLDFMLPRGGSVGAGAVLGEHSLVADEANMSFAALRDPSSMLNMLWEVLLVFILAPKCIMNEHHEEVGRL